MKTSLSVQTAAPTVDIIVPTWNNQAIFSRMLASVVRYTSEPVRIIVVNNGNAEMSFPTLPNIVALNLGRNAGWMGGINAGLKWTAENNPSKFVMFINDDVQVMGHDYGWLTKMLNCFGLDERIGAVGPTSNAIMGYQSIYADVIPPAIESSRLSGMCMLLKREAVDKIGMLDESLPGGDDLDYSMRLISAGYKLCICRRAFLLHHYASTGKRIYGEYWDSASHSEAINTALIKKNGFKNWFLCITDSLAGGTGFNFSSPEEQFALEKLCPIINGGGKVLDLGCGGKKIHERAIGVDIRKNGQLGVGANLEAPSVGDIEADVTSLPVDSASVDGILARHLLEHIIDPINALREWKRVLKNSGTLLIICPDYRFCEAISVDPSHVHAFTPESVASLLEVSGFGVAEIKNVKPGYVFMISAVKIPTLELAEVA